MEIELFMKRVANIIHDSKLPSSVINMCLSNILLQIQIGSLQLELDNKNAIINKMSELESKIEKEKEDN